MKIFDMAARAHGGCFATRSGTDISGGDCVKEPSKRAQEMTHACDQVLSEMMRMECGRCNGE